MSAAGPAAVVFDFDGVIADTEGLHLRATQQVFAGRGWTLEEREYFDRYMGYDDRGLVAEFARDHAIALGDADLASLVAAKAAAYASMLDAGDVLYRGAADTVRALATAYPLAIASGALHVEIVTILRAAGLAGAFRAIVGADDVPVSKPAPDPYLAAARGLGVPPASCVAIEDTIWGLRAARAAGMRTIAVTTTSPRAALAEADLILDGVHDVTLEAVRRAAQR